MELLVGARDNVTGLSANICWIYTLGDCFVIKLKSLCFSWIDCRFFYFILLLLNNFFLDLHLFLSSRLLLNLDLFLGWSWEIFSIESLISLIDYFRILRDHDFAFAIFIRNNFRFNIYFFLLLFMLELRLIMRFHRSREGSGYLGIRCTLLLDQRLLRFIPCWHLITVVIYF